MKTDVTVNVAINGRYYRADIDPRTTLVDFIRNVAA